MFKYLSILIFFFSCSPKQKDCLEKFNKEIGEEYATALEDLTTEFDRNVMKSEGANFAEKCRNFLTPLSEGRDQFFIEEIEKNRNIEKSIAILDKMIFKYDTVQFNGNKTRRYISTKWNSDYIKALSSIKECDILIAQYVKTIEDTGGIGPNFIANAAIINYSERDFDNPINKRILAVEILLPYLTNPD